MYTADRNLGFDIDFTALVPALAKGYTQYQGVKNQIQIERSRAASAAEQARIASAAAAAARNAQSRGGLVMKIVPYAAGVAVGLGLLYYLTRR